MTSERTPGPWKYSLSFRGGFEVYHEDSSITGARIATVRSVDNAALIAAAPDTAAERDRLRAANVELLEALKVILPMARQCPAEYPISENQEKVLNGVAALLILKDMGDAKAKEGGS